MKRSKTAPVSSPSTFTSVKLRRSASRPSRVRNTCTLAPRSSTAMPMMSVLPAVGSWMLLALQDVPHRLQPIAVERRQLEVLDPEAAFIAPSMSAATSFCLPWRKATTWSMIAP